MRCWVGQHGFISIAHCDKTKHKVRNHQQRLKSFNFLFFCFVLWCCLILNEVITSIFFISRPFVNKHLKVHQDWCSLSRTRIRVCQPQMYRTKSSLDWTKFWHTKYRYRSSTKPEKDRLKNYLRTDTFSSECWDGMTGLVVAFFALRSAYIPVPFLSCNAL